ncbi:MAG: hypothetical protein R6V03_08580 [Kiritimatiellia bacterium]
MHKRLTLCADKIKRRKLEKIGREEMAAYFQAMRKDPLLPSELLSSAYMGRRAWDIHCNLVIEIARRL